MISRWNALVDLLAKAYGRGSQTPTGYPTWQEFIVADVLTGTGIGQPPPAETSGEEWRAILMAMIEFGEAV